MCGCEFCENSTSIVLLLRVLFRVVFLCSVVVYIFKGWNGSGSAEYKVNYLKTVTQRLVN